MNVLIYVLDALRADHLSCYGYNRETTPNLDAIAEDGTIYENCFSPATWTKPVGASLLTGAYPPTHGVRKREDIFNANITRLPEFLSEEGFTTAGFSTMGNVSQSLGYDWGFDHFEDLYKDPDIVDKRATKKTDSEELEHEDQTRVALPRAEDLTDHASDWLERHDGDDYFMFCWSIEPHIPYDPPPGFQDFTDDSYDGSVNGSRERLPDVETDADLEQLRALYDGEIRYNDAEFARLIDRLQERGEYDETLIIVCGDHGDAFKEHGQLTHGHLPYDELSHVPLMIKPPETTDITQGTVNEIASLVDVAPTVLKATDVLADKKTIQGRALPPFGSPGTSAPVFSETRSRDIYPAFYSVRTERWKYMEVDKPDRSIETLTETIKQVYNRGLISEIVKHPLYYYRRYRHDQDCYLYDIVEDPAEKENLIQEAPETAADLESQLQSWLKECEAIRESVEQRMSNDIDEATDNQLRQLGYID